MDEWMDEWMKNTSHLIYNASYKIFLMALQPVTTHPIFFVPSKRQTETRVGTFNFAADDGDRFYLQPAQGENEKDGEAEEREYSGTK